MCPTYLVRNNVKEKKYTSNIKEKKYTSDRKIEIVLVSVLLMKFKCLYFTEKS